MKDPFGDLIAKLQEYSPDDAIEACDDGGGFVRRVVGVSCVGGSHVTGADGAVVIQLEPLARRS